MKYMSDFGNSRQNISEFNILKKGLSGAKKIGSKLFGDGDVMWNNTKIPKAGFIDKAAGIGTLAVIPTTIGSMLLPDANTRAVQSMRLEDKAREAKGLKPLAATPQLIAEQAEKAKNAVSKTVGNIRNTNPAPNSLPGPLPPNSLLDLRR